MEHSMIDKHSYDGFIKPGRVFGNLYFVGTRPASSHLIDTGDGLILIDPGMPDALWIVLDNIRELGFRENDIKIILMSHGHYDHAGATRELKELTGAITYIGKGDFKMVTGEEDTALSDVPDYRYTNNFIPDVLLEDGDCITLGSTSILCLSTPGHTDGTMSFFFDVSDNEKTYLAGMHGGVGSNTLTRDFLQKNSLPLSNRDRFLMGLERVREKKVEVFLGNHVANNNTEEKLSRVEAGEKDAFYAPEEWECFLEQTKNKIKSLIKNERRE